MRKVQHQRAVAQPGKSRVAPAGLLVGLSIGLCCWPCCQPRALDEFWRFSDCRRRRASLINSARFRNSHNRHLLTSAGRSDRPRRGCSAAWWRCCPEQSFESICPVTARFRFSICGLKHRVVFRDVPEVLDILVCVCEGRVIRRGVLEGVARQHRLAGREATELCPCQLRFLRLRTTSRMPARGPCSWCRLLTCRPMPPRLRKCLSSPGADGIAQIGRVLAALRVDKADAEAEPDGGHGGCAGAKGVDRLVELEVALAFGAGLEQLACRSRAP